MSFSRAKRDTIKDYILNKISNNETDILKKTVEAFQITENTYYRYLRELKKDGIIYKPSGSKNYKLSDTFFSKKYELNSENTASDDKIYVNDIYPLINDLPENVIRMWDYCFTEMMNNVIDHSAASHVQVTVIKNYINTTIILDDDGVGIFKKIQAYFHYESMEDVIMELFKGKLTTDNVNHSGEGIFFTSRIADFFAAISDGKVFSHSNYLEVLRDLHELPGGSSFLTGTTIIIRISNHSKKTPAEIFNAYADVDGGFTRTCIPLKNIYDRYPVSRSQAKRLAHRFDDFREIDLDFTGISDIGQGFAHQLFSVYKTEHPEVMLNPINANDTIQRMIFHVTHTQ